jgi:SLOG family YspA-like protein
MKLIIAGSRSITNYDAVRQGMIQSGLWKKHKQAIEVVCGMAKGVDKLGLEFANKNGLDVWEFPAEWDDIKADGAVVRQTKDGVLYNAAAGHWRNQDMADFSEALLLLWDGKSTGSRDMLNRARKKGLEVHAYRYHDGRLFGI